MDSLREREDELLTPAEVAEVFRVSAKTVTRWARSGRITAIRTLGGHRRFRLSEVQRAFDEMVTVQTVGMPVADAGAPVESIDKEALATAVSEASTLLKNAMAYLHGSEQR